MRDTDVLALMSGWHGAARREDLLAHGASRADIERLLRSGLIRRVHRGVFVHQDANLHRVVATTLRASLTCASAAELWGLAALQSESSTHIAVPASRGFARVGNRPLAQAHVHYDRSNDVRHVAVGGELRPLVRPEVAIAHASACLTRESLLVMADSALNGGYVTRGQLAVVQGISSDTRAWLMRYVDGRAQSLIETLTRLELRTAGFACEPQVHVPGVGRVDLLVENRLVVEVDGRQYHSGAPEFAEDRRRDRELTLLGFPVLRYTFDDVMRHRTRITTDVRRVLAGMAWPTLPSARQAD